MSSLPLPVLPVSKLSHPPSGRRGALLTVPSTDRAHEPFHIQSGLNHKSEKVEMEETSAVNYLPKHLSSLSFGLCMHSALQRG